MGDYQKTLGQAIDETLKAANDYKGSGLNGFTFTRTEAKHALVRLYLNFARDTASMKGEDTITLVEDQNIYTLPTDCIYPIRVAVSIGSVYVLTSKALSDMRIEGVPRNQSGTPYSQWRDQLRYNQIGIWPMPGISLDGETVTVNYVRTPSTWSAEDTVPDAAFPEWLQKDMRYGAAASLLSTSSDQAKKRKAAFLEAYWAYKLNTFKQMHLNNTVEEGMAPA